MYCPYCNGYNISVVDSKSVSKTKNYRRRRYKCADCGKKFSTLELPVIFQGLKVVSVGTDTTAVLFQNVKGETS